MRLRKQNQYGFKKKGERSLEKRVNDNKQTSVKDSVAFKRTDGC